jgi:hypothetical protein
MRYVNLTSIVNAVDLRTRQVPRDIFHLLLKRVEWGRALGRALHYIIIDNRLDGQRFFLLRSARKSSFLFDVAASEQARVSGNEQGKILTSNDSSEF